MALRPFHGPARSLGEQAALHDHPACQLSGTAEGAEGPPLDTRARICILPTDR